MEKNWKVSGTYFEACTCEVACPCSYKNTPTEGSCTALVGWHVDQGKFGETSLDGLNAMLAAYAPGNMQEGNWKVALYLDDRADGKQQEALQSIFSGSAGGHLGALGPFIGEVMGIRSAKIDYQAEGRKRSLKVDDLASAEVEAIEGLDGGEVTLDNPPFTVAPGVPLVIARSTSARYNDHGIKLDISGRNGFYSPFTYQPA